jgi:hypothetical protein
VTFLRLRLPLMLLLLWAVGLQELLLAVAAG